MASGSTILSYSSGSSTIKNSIGFNNGGGTGLSFIAANEPKPYENLLITIQRTGRQHADLVDGDPYFYLRTSMKDLAGISTPSRITSFTVTYNWDANNDQVWSQTGTNAAYAAVHFMGNKIIMRWFGDPEPTSVLGRCQLTIPTSDTPIYSPPLPVSYNGNFTPVQRLDYSGGLGLTFANVPSVDQTYSFSFNGSSMDFLSEDIFTIKQPICLRIPAFQHSYDFWPFNAGKAMVYLQWNLKSITFNYTYDTITEYRGIFYSQQSSLIPGTTNLYKDGGFTTALSPNGYVSDGVYFYYVVNGLVTNIKKCQNNLNVGLFGNGTVSSAYPYTASGTGTYSFDQDVTYITLQSSPTYGDSLVSWRVVDFSGNSTDLSPTSSINIYNGDYESVTAIYTSSGSSPTCYRYNVTYTAFITYFPCGEAETSSQFFSGDAFCAESVTGGATTLWGRCDEYV